MYTVTLRRGVRIKVRNGVARSLCEAVEQYVIKIEAFRKEKKKRGLKIINTGVG